MTKFKYSICKLMIIIIEINTIHKFMKIIICNLSLETIRLTIFNVKEFREIIKTNYSDVGGRKNPMKFIFMLSMMMASKHKLVF